MWNGLWKAALQRWGLGFFSLYIVGQSDKLLKWKRTSGKNQLRDGEDEFTWAVGRVRDCKDSDFEEEGKEFWREMKRL